MFHTSRDDQKLAFMQLDGTVAEFDPKISFPDEKKFVLAVVMMPDKFAFEFDELNLLPVQFRNDLRTPMIGEEGKLLLQINLTVCSHPIAFQSHEVATQFLSRIFNLPSTST